MCRFKIVGINTCSKYGSSFSYLTDLISLSSSDLVIIESHHLSFRWELEKISQEVRSFTLVQESFAVQTDD